MKNLLVVAHPDDETLFFGGLVQALPGPWHIVCVTDGAGTPTDAPAGAPVGSPTGSIDRRDHFSSACRALRVKKHEMWNFRDDFSKRLDVEAVAARLEKLQTLETYSRVFTHGVAGEYGHPHHQDVSLAVHRAFKKSAEIFSLALQEFPTLQIHLTASQYRLKTSILQKIYFQEMKELIHFVGAASSEGFVKIDPREVEKLYSWYVKRGDAKRVNKGTGSILPLLPLQ